MLTCTPGDAPGRLRCPIDAARLVSVPLRPADAAQAATIARQEAGWLADATVELAMTPDGRITSYDLLLPESTDPRIRRAQGRLTAWVRPAVGGLDLLLADGDSWQDPTTELLRLPSDQASASKARVQTTATPTDGGLLLTSEGSGLTSGPALSVSYRARSWSEARFDTADGSLAERSWGLAAVRTAASDGGSPAGAASYVAWGAARRVDGTAPTLAASGAAATEGTPQLLVDALADAGGTVAVRAARMAGHPPVGLWLGGGRAG